MIIYVWPDGNWCYHWEVHGFTMEHKATLEGGRWIDLDKLWGMKLTLQEETAIQEALGE